MHEVFISYSSKDKTVADAACSVLENKGIRCWVAPRDIVAGVEWGGAIIDGIINSKMMLLILTKNSNVSSQVLREIERAANIGIPILPMRLTSDPLSKSLEYFLSSAHWLDAYEGTIKDNLETMCESVTKLLNYKDTSLKVKPKTSGFLQMKKKVIGLITGGFIITALLIMAIMNSVNKKDLNNKSIENTKSDLPNKKNNTPNDIPPISETIGQFGVFTQTLLDEVSKKLNVPERSVVIRGKIPEQPADLFAGDIVIKFDGIEINGLTDLLNKTEFDKPKINKKYTITINRNNQNIDVNIKVLPKSIELPIYNDRPVFGEINKLKSSSDNSTVMALEVKGNNVLSINIKGNAEIWSLSLPNLSGKIFFNESCSTGTLNNDGSIAFLATKKTGEIIAWDTTTDRQQFKLEGHPNNEIISLFLISNEKKLVSYDESGKVLVWDLDSKKIASNLNVKKHIFLFFKLYSNGLQYSNDKNYLLLRNGSKCLFWNINDDKIEAEIDAGSPIDKIKISPDSKYLALGITKGTIQLWDLQKGIKEKTLRGHESDIKDIVFLNSNILISASDDKKIRIWDIDNEHTEWGYSVSDQIGNRFYTSPQFIQMDLTRKSLWTAGTVIRELKLPDDLKIIDSNLSKKENQPLLFSSLLSKKETPAFENSLKKSPDQLQIKSEEITSNIKTSYGSGEMLESISYADGSSINTRTDISGNVLKRYFTPASWMGGLDITIKTEADGARVTEISEESSAKGKLFVDDIIVSISEKVDSNSKKLIGLPLADIQRLTMGKTASIVKLEIVRSNAKEPIIIECSRGKSSLQKFSSNSNKENMKTVEKTTKPNPDFSSNLNKEKMKTVEKAIKPNPAKFDFKNTIDMCFVKITPKDFIMGDLDSTLNKSDTKYLPHRVRLTKPFYMSVFETTRADYLKIAGNDPSDLFLNHDRDSKIRDSSYYPVQNITWEQANEFCKLLTKKEGRVYRLPTEAEWEYSVCAEKKDRYYWGKDIFLNENFVSFGFHTSQCGSKTPNAYGLYDMIGNVSEWCQDNFNESYYIDSESIDPKGPEKFNLFKVIRGSDYRIGQDYTSCYRGFAVPSKPSKEIGFRVVLEPTKIELDEFNKSELEKNKIPDVNLIQASNNQLKTATLLFEKANDAFKNKNTTLGKKLLSEAFEEYPGLFLAKDKFDIDNLIAINYSEGEKSKLIRCINFYEEGVKNSDTQTPFVCYMQALDIDTEKIAIAWILNNLAYDLATTKNKKCKDPQAAIKYAQRACELSNWRYYAFVETLADCYFEAGDLKNAIKACELYLKIAPAKKLKDSGEPEPMIKEIEKNLEKMRSSVK